MARPRNFWLVVVFFALLPIFPLWKAVFLGLCIGPFDQIRQMAPWMGPASSQPWDILQADSVLQFFPWRDLVLNSWSHFSPPYWNPYELAGTPLLANSQSGVFYPPHILLGILHVPTVIGITLLAWFHLSFAGVGLYRLTKAIGGSTTGALIGGATFCLSPFLISWTALSSVVATVCYIPWILAGIVNGLKSKPGNDRIGFCQIALATTLMLLAGHLQFAAYGLGAAAFIFAAEIVINRPKLPGIAGVGGSLLAGLLIASVQILPVLSFSRLSNRQNAPNEAGYSSYIKLAIQPFELGTLANPLALGDPRSFADEKNSTFSTYWPAFLKPGGNYAESAICIGPLALLLLCLVDWRGRRIYPIAALAVIALFLCTGTALNRLLYFGVPGWSASGSPGRIGVLFVLCICVLAGSARLGPPTRKQTALLGLLAVFAVVSSLLSPSLAPSSPAEFVTALQTVATANGNIVLVQLLGLTVIGIALLVYRPLERFRGAIVIVPLLLFASGGGLQRIMAGAPLEGIASPSPHERVAYLNRDWNPYQVPSGATMPPNLSSIFHIHELGGYDSLMSGDTVDYLQKVNNENPAPAINGNIMFIKNELDERLKEAGVTAVGIGKNLQPIPAAPGRVSFTGKSASIKDEDLSSVTVEATGGGNLVLRDRNLPGWTAKVDGRAIPIEPGIWRSLTVEGEGPHSVIFTYEPPMLKMGELSSLVGILLLLAILGLSNRRARTEDPSF